MFKIQTIILLFVFFTISSYGFSKEIIFEEVDGLVAVEAEHFIDQTKTAKRQWYLFSKDSIPNIKPDADVPHTSTASNGAYLEILPDTRRTDSDPLVHGESFSNTPGIVAIINYKVHFNTPGKYYVWVRAHSTGTEDNGIHVGLDGKWPSSGQRMQWCDGKRKWYWESKQRTNEIHCGVLYGIFLNIPSKGVHTISFSMREDGFEFDKWLMTTDRYFKRPSDAGPEERLYQPQAIEDKNIQIDENFNLNQNYPNPFNPTTNIMFSLPADGYVTLNVFDTVGKHVATILSENKIAGQYNVQFNAVDLSSGIYYYKLQQNNLSLSRKFVILK